MVCFVVKCERTKTSRGACMHIPCPDGPALQAERITLRCNTLMQGALKGTIKQWTWTIEVSQSTRTGRQRNEHGAESGNTTGAPEDTLPTKERQAFSLACTSTKKKQMLEGVPPQHGDYYPRLALPTGARLQNARRLCLTRPLCVWGLGRPRF